MSDSTIINAISKIHFTIISFLTFIGLIFLLLFIMLYQGFTVEKLILPGFKIEQLYIKWNEKLALEAESITITKSNMQQKRAADLSVITKTFEAVKWLDVWVESVEIDKIQVNDIHGSFRYKMGGRGFISLVTPDIHLLMEMGFNGHHVVADIKRIRHLKHNIHVEGQSVIDLDTFSSYSALKVNVAQSADLTLLVEADRDSLSFSASSNQPITATKPIVDIFGLQKYISRWIVDKADGRELSLHTLEGSFPYNDPAHLLKTLYAKATYEDLAYRFADALEPIETDHTDLVFEEGVLKIYPNKPTFYAQDAGQSWLDIDFSGKEVILTAYILAEARLNKDILHLLEHYDITLPFRQITGTTATDLTLEINLNKIFTEARGSFLVDRGVFRYENMDLNVSDAEIKLVNADLDITKLDIAYRDNFHADVSGEINLGEQRGKLNIIADNVKLPAPQQPFVLDDQTDLHVVYKIGPKRDIIVFGDSHWRYGAEKIAIEGFKAPFDFEQYATTVPPVFVSVDALADAYVSGQLNLKSMHADIKANLVKFQYQDISLDQSYLPLAVIYDDNLNIHFKELSRWKIGTGNLNLYPTHLLADKENFSILKNRFSVNETAYGQAVGTYQMTEGKGVFGVDGFSLRNSSGNYLFASDETIRLNVTSRSDGTHLNVAAMGIGLMLEDQNWSLSVSDFGKLAGNSPFLQDYNLTNGSLFVESKGNSLPYRFNGKIHYPYPVIVRNNEPLTDYTFTGEYSAGQINMMLNEQVSVNIGENITIKSDGVGYNLGAILAFINDHDDGQSDEEAPELFLEASNSYVYLTPDRKADAEKLTLNKDESSIYARLEDKGGSAVFEYHDDSFYLYGQDFSDTFMSHLLALAEYKGGKMGFAINGTTSKADGIVRVNDTIVKDYKVLNNVLAFINTIPSLTTFSLPHYAKEGIAVSEAYADFTYEDGKVHVKGVKVDSHEIDIVGDGLIDYTNNAIDMELNLITDLGSNVGKVPLVGYILLGEDGSISTTLKVKGKLDDPQVKTAIAKDIVVAPFNIIKRTLTFPFQIFK